MDQARIQTANWKALQKWTALKCKMKQKKYPEPDKWFQMQWKGKKFHN